MTKRVLALISSIVMLINVMMPSFAVAEEKTTLVISLSSDAVNVGEEFMASVRFNDLSKAGIDLNTVGSIQVELSYPSDYIEFVSCDEDNDVFYPAKAIVEINYNKIGAVTYGLIASKGITLSDSDILFKVKLKAKATITNVSITAMCESLADVSTKTADVSAASIPLTITNPCTGITLDKDTLTIARGETATLTATVKPADTTDNVVWSSADKTIATVENGVVTAVGQGETTITATCGNQTASCKVIVNKAFLTGKVTISGNAVYGVTLTATYKGNADNVEYTWYREGDNKPVGTTNTYKITENDIDKVLTVYVGSDNFLGNVSAKTGNVEKATQDAPAKPEIKAEEKKIIVTNPNTNVEYRLGSTGKFDKKTTEFTVDYDKSYYVEARYPETATHKASAIVTSDKVTTPKAPCNLTVTAGEGGTVDGIPEDTVREGDGITLTAAPDIDHKFEKWEAKGVTLTDVNKPTITFTMGSEDVTITAVFKEKPTVPVGFGEDKTFTYNKKEQAPTYGPTEQGDMKVEVKYFVRGGNTPIEKPTNVGKYTMQVTYTPNSADSECRTTVATCDFEIIKANQDAPAVPTVKDIKSDGFTVENFVTEQQYAIKTTNVTPEEAEWKNGSEFVNPVTGLKPATTYYVFTRVKGNNNYNPSPAVYATVTTAHTYAWKVEGSGVVGVNVRVGGTLPESLTGTIKNEGTGTITNIKAALSGENVDNFKLDAVSTELASNGTLNIIVKPQGITTDNKGSYNVDVKVTADEVEYKIISFVISVVEKDPVIITGIDDKTVTFNGKTQGIDLSKANISGDAVDVSKLTVTYTKDGKTVAEPRDAGTYDVAISYEDTNYIGSTTAKLIIKKQDVTLTGLTVDNKDYKGDTVAYVHYDKATLKDKIEGTDVNFDTTGIVFEFEDKNVGENKTVKNTKPITLTGTDKDNYNLTNPTVELTADITRKPVTVTAAVAEKTYNGRTDDANVTISFDGVIDSDEVTYQDAKGTYANAYAGDAVEVEVTYIIGGKDAGNYSLNVVKTATGKVKKADLNVTLTAPAAVIYDGNTHGVSGVKDDRVKADEGKTLYTLTYAGGDALPVDAGTYSATAKLTDEGSKNYNLKADTVKVEINNAGMSATNKGYSVAFMLAGAQTRPLSDLQLTPANVSGKWSVAIKDNMENILDGASIDGENLVFTIKSGLGLGDIGGFAKLDVTFTPDKNYNPVTATVTVTLAQDTYTNSIVGTLPTQVKLGDALDFTGVQLVTKFGSGAPEQTLDVTDAAKVEMTTTYDAAATGEAALGAKTVTFTDKANSGINYTHTFTVVDMLEGVNLEADPTAYNYKLKEASSIGFDDKVHAVYKSGAKKALTHAGVVLTMSDGTVVDSAKEARLLNTLGTATITITYTEKYFDGTSDKQSVAITVSVTADPVKPDGKPNAEGFAVTPIPDAGKEMEYKDGAGNKVEPENVQGKLADAAPGALEEEVKKNPAFNNVGNSDVVYENISFKDENGNPVTFANGKMQVTVPYPADSDKGDEFVMLIPDGEGKMKAIVPQKTAGGLQFEIENSNVTFAIGWYTPAPSPVLPTEPERDPEDNFWNEVYWTLLRSGQGSVITANAGYYDRVPQGVLRAVDISGNTLIINSAFGMQVVVNPGALEKLGMYRFYYPISYLKEMLKGSSVISGSGTTGITVGVLMPTTGDATVVEHPYTMTPATAGIIPGLESAANARPVIDNADGVSVLDGAQRNEGAVIGGGMLIGLGLLALLGAAYVTMRKRGN